MTAALLKQAREALEQIDAYPIPMTGDPEDAKFAMRNIQGVAARTLKVLTAFDSLSEYDKAIHALAIYLGEGEYIYWSGALRRYSQDLTYLTTISSLEIPPPPEGDNGARRITHNSDGTVTVERG